MTMEEALTAVQKIVDAWEGFTKSMLDAAQVLSDLFRGLYESSKVGCERAGMSPKQYGMSLHRWVRSSPPRYQFVPVAPRNQPYQRRAF